MISPFTGGHATLKYEKRELTYRKETYSYIAQFYEDDQTQEQFTTTEMDEANITQVYNQYRIKHSIPFVDEIIALRATYGLSALKMSAILGFGNNQYRQYEEGYVPTESNGKILKACLDPHIFETFVKNSRQQLTEKEYNKIIDKVESVKSQYDHTDIRQNLIFGKTERCAENGFASQSIQKLQNVILYFIDKCNGVFNTKMNKLLFYTDFLNYRQHGQAITGIAYRAIQYGPVPVRWDRIYSLLDCIEQDLIEFKSGDCGTRLISTQKPDLSMFSPSELSTLEIIAERFRKVSASEISEMSHKEKAWKQFIDTNQPIEFCTAFSLLAV